MDINIEELERLIIGRAVAQANAALRTESEWWAKELVRAVTESAKCSARIEKLEVRVDDLMRGYDNICKQGEPSSAEAAHIMKGLAESVLALEGSLSNLRGMVIETRDTVAAGGCDSHADERLLALQVQVDGLQACLEQEKTRVDDVKYCLNFERQAIREDHRIVLEKMENGFTRIMEHRESDLQGAAGNPGGMSALMTPFEGPRGQSTPMMRPLTTSPGRASMTTSPSRSPLTTSPCRNLGSSLSLGGGGTNSSSKFALAAASAKAAASGVGMSSAAAPGALACSQSMPVLPSSPGTSAAAALAAAGLSTRAEKAGARTEAPMTGWDSSAAPGTGFGIGEFQPPRAQAKDHSFRHRELYTKMESGLQNLLHRLDSNRPTAEKMPESCSSAQPQENGLQNLLQRLESNRTTSEKTLESCSNAQPQVERRAVAESGGQFQPRAMGGQQTNNGPGPELEPKSGVAPSTSVPRSVVSTSRPCSADSRDQPAVQRDRSNASPGPVLRGPPPPWMVPRAGGSASPVRGGSTPPSAQVSARTASTGAAAPQGDERDGPR